MFILWFFLTIDGVEKSHQIERFQTLQQCHAVRNFVEESAKAEYAEDYVKLKLRFECKMGSV